MSQINDLDGKVSERESLIREEDEEEVDPMAGHGVGDVVAVAPVRRERLLIDGCDTEE